MAKFLIQVAYTPEAWSNLVKNPQDRIQAVRPSVERIGGSIVDAWFAFGEYDVLLVVDYPDNVSAAALAIAFTAGGACKAVKTTTLMTIAEGIEAMKKAGGTGYRPPASQS